MRIIIEQNDKRPKDGPRESISMSQEYSHAEKNSLRFDKINPIINPKKAPKNQTLIFFLFII